MRARRDARRNGSHRSAARPRLRGLRREGHGMRSRRLLQLRRPDARRRWRVPSRAIVRGRSGPRGRPDTVGLMDLSLQIGSLRLKNPLIAASGCFGYGVEYADVVDLAALGAIVSKGLFPAPRE